MGACFLRQLLAHRSCAPEWFLWRWATGKILLLTLLQLQLQAAVQVLQAQRRVSSRAGSMPLAMLLVGVGGHQQ
jgi:hypothetical protein